MSRANSYTILLIEPDASLRRLIALGLHYQGMQVVEVSSLATLGQQAIAHPDLLLLDLDNGICDDPSLLATVEAHPYLSTLPLVILAWERMLPANQITALPLREYLAKPFDARVLYATVESILETSAAIELAAGKMLSPIPATTLASSASFCPLMTAAGLLLTVIGLLLLQLLVVGVGGLVMLVALLWWTLGQRSPQSAPSVTLVTSQS